MTSCSPAACVVCRIGFIPDHGYPIDMAYPKKLSGHDLTDIAPEVVSCPSCHHQFIHPVPSSQFFEDFYSQYMVQARSGFYRDRTASIISTEFRKRYDSWLVRLRDLASDADREPRLLDVGAGLGMFLRLAQEQGFEVHGLERNTPACEALMRDYQIPTINSTLEDYSGDERFDVVTMWDLLEHLPDPRAGLVKARSLLRPGGVFALEIPIRDSLLHWTAKGLFRASGGRIRRPLYLVCGVHHLHYFSQKGMQRLMRESGFEPIEDHRGETSLAALHKQMVGSLSSRITAAGYNAALDAAFAAARLAQRQNKLIVFARAI